MNEKESHVFYRFTNSEVVSMPIDLNVLARKIQPERTVLLFGAGSSIPSGGYSGQDLAKHLAAKLNESTDPTLTLAETATILEKRRGRQLLISALQELLGHLKPTGGLMNIAHYSWKTIYTTNYDTLIEQCFKRSKKPYYMYSSNFDFQTNDPEHGTPILKLHGTINKDVSKGHMSRIILTVSDYDLTEKFRETLFSRMQTETLQSDMVIIGYSLSDPDIKEIIDRAVRVKKESGAPGRIYLILYTNDEDRASIYEQRGVEVSFGAIDDFLVRYLKNYHHNNLSYR